MVEYNKYVLSNGLKLLMHKDSSTPMAAVNVLYDVGAKDEDPDKTGFAHLFEHLMFEGSVNVSDFDGALQMAGGENNAFTSNDITNYYITIPRENIETALWLESDRMLELGFSEQKLKIQQDVVTEEFRQSYLNQPYGDVWMLLRDMVYRTHPYRWPTIGKSIEHVQQAKLSDVRAFFFKHYRPCNAIISIAGDFEYEEMIAMVEKWFGDIPPGIPYQRSLPQESPQTEERRLEVKKDVPFDEIYLAFPTGGRLDADFYCSDLLSDILAGGRSARLMENLVKKKKIFSETNAWITGSMESGFFTVKGKLHKGVSFDRAEQEIWHQLEKLKTEPIADGELQKVKNKLEASNTFSEVGLLSRAMNLAYYELLGDANLLNQQNERYFEITPEHLLSCANDIFHPRKRSVLKYASIGIKNQ